MDALTATLEKMKATQAKDEAAAAKVYRELAHLLAGNKELTAKQTTELADALDTLKLTAAHLTDDVTAIRQHDALKPAAETANAKCDEISAAQKLNLAEEEKLRAKVATMNGQRALMTQQMLALSQSKEQFHQIARSHPRVLG